MKKIKFRYNGKTKTLQETSHAALFRSFFDYWKKLDLEQTIYGTFESGLRLSNDEYYESTVIKKKNLEIVEDMYIITHITPAAMDKGLFGFLDAVGADVLEPKRPKPKNEDKKPTLVIEDDDDNEQDGNENENNDNNTDDKEKENNKPSSVTPPEVLEAIVASLRGGKAKKTEISMAQLVAQKMKERDDEIKEKLRRNATHNKD